MFTTIRKLRTLLFGSRAARSYLPRRATLAIEPLERRELPAAYIWTGANNKDGTNLIWSDPGNWLLDGTQTAQVAPGKNDSNRSLGGEQ